LTDVALAFLIFIFFALVLAWWRVAIRGGSITKQWWPLVLAVFLSWNVVVPLVIRSATYHGKVVDEETGNPISGAVVTAIWYQSPIIQMAQTRSYQNAQETVAGDDGSFSLWTWPGISINPFTYVMSPPHAIIYKAGYAPLSVQTTYDRGYRSYERLADDLKKGIVMKLPKLRTKEESMRSVDLSDLSIIDVPHHKIPRLIRQVNVHRKSVGLTSLYPEPRL
jgi:hypothetical protein